MLTRQILSQCRQTRFDFVIQFVKPTAGALHQPLETPVEVNLWFGMFDEQVNDYAHTNQQRLTAHQFLMLLNNGKCTGAQLNFR
ncbi:hypothetical protein D3C80_1768120 [compost metagenome]